MNQLAPSPGAAPKTLLSSRDRDWRGFSAALYAMPGGPVRVERTPLTLVSVHVGAPQRVRCRLEGGAAHRRSQRHGDIDVVPAGMSGVWHDEEPGMVLLLRLSPDLVGRAAAQMGRDPARAHLSPQAQLRDPRLQHIAWAIRAELEAGDHDRGDPLYAESLGLALAAQLLRGASGQPAIAGAAARRGGLGKARRERVAAHVAAHLDGDLSLPALCRVAGLGPSQFKALFHDSFGLPVHQYVIWQRVEAACRLLQDRAGPGLAEIALSCGFSHQSHMARCMRRVLGVSPMMLRRGPR